MTARQNWHKCLDPVCPVHGRLRAIPLGWKARCTTSPNRFSNAVPRRSWWHRIWRFRATR